MSNYFWKKFHSCFSKLKSVPTIQTPPNKDPIPSPMISTTPCSIILKNFNTLYDLNSSDSTDFFSSSDDSDGADSPPDFTTIFASHRFFFPSPGRSNSIFESLDAGQDPENALVNGSVKVPKYSLDPYIDFRRSMQEMAEARNLTDVTREWEYLHELLLCYLTLNPKHTHRYIIRAFADLVICIFSSSSSPTFSAANHRRESKNRRQRYISQ
ncbi:transcription repressor OFP12-like [Juglans microcarpa x Juglans regia]|uniref:transcription repressor OFP12-like n=1 Tax=Juglans microcarpa x Juglans regia TaxID=2249226 RepID=UPI001B7F2E19|nr:transcription repressor OFP12-like [Juglans microcarpa x Juglans regia]